MTKRVLTHPAWSAAYESPIARRLAPFAAVAVTGLLVVATALDLKATGVWIAGVLGAIAGAMVLWVPWRRLPSWAGAIPALLFIGGVASLRDAAGGPVAGISPLFLLPVVWLGLYGNRRQLAIVVPAIGLAFFVPILLVGAPEYPASQWHAGVIYVALSLLIGPNVQRLIRHVKAQADEARRREVEIARVADVARQLSTGEGTRRDVCAAACDLGGSAFALLWERDDSGHLVITAAAGIEPPELVLDPAGERTGTTVAFRTAEPVFVAEADREPRMSGHLTSLVRAPGGSILFQPVMRRGDAVGVLVLGWGERVDHAEDRLRVMVGLLAAEAAIAIERADLMTRLEELADTDELTGLPNRRSWNRELSLALSTADRRRTPLCVALIDVDFFKEVNDERGHQAGDRLLKAAAAAWRSTLRPADILARPGGDEFTLLLPDCDLGRARTVLERLRAATPAGRTCSIGVAMWDRRESGERLYARADDALYAAKEAGRDRVVGA
jgi:diguanylate cyclase (GGDEF)-like protein